MDFQYKDYSKKGYLQYLANKFGDFKVTKSIKNIDGSITWWKHYSVLECSESEKGMWILSQVTHRTCLECEIILDMDDDININRVNEISKYLNKYDLQHCIFFTGSRGYHIHIFTPNLNNSTILRSFLIKRFNCDGLKSSNKAMVALEFCDHWKSGKKKYPIDEYKEKWWFL